MSGLLLAAGLVAIVTGVLHAVLGEILILRHLDRLDGLPPLLGSKELPKQTLRFTWHLPSILAWAFAAILIRYARLAELGADDRFVVATISVAFLVCAGIVLLINRGRHPGWTAFLGAGVLCWMAIA